MRITRRLLIGVDLELDREEVPAPGIVPVDSRSLRCGKSDHRKGQLTWPRLLLRPQHPPSQQVREVPKRTSIIDSVGLQRCNAASADATGPPRTINGAL